MLSELWCPLLTLFCIAWITWIFIPNHRRINPRLPPGPLGLPIVGSLPFLDSDLKSYFIELVGTYGPLVSLRLGNKLGVIVGSASDLKSYFTELVGTYGPLVSLRLGNKLGVIVGSASVAKEVLKDLDLTFANRDPSAAAKESTYGGIDIAWRSHGPKWRMLRKIYVREMLGSTPLEALRYLRKQEVHRTMMHLQERQGSVVNVGEQMFLTGMNVITSMLWGGTVRGADRERVGSQFRALTTDTTTLLSEPNLSYFFPWLARFDLHGIKKKMRATTKSLDDIFEEVIDHHRKTKNDDRGKDFLHSLLELNANGDSEASLSMAELKALFMDIVMGGTDTTSNTVEFAMAEMMKAPHIMKKAPQELEDVVGIGNPVEESHIQQLPYLQAIMKEALRLHPIVPLLVPHCPSQTCIVGGYTIPKGSRVFINAWAIHKDPSFWVDPLKFKSERFLDQNLEFHGNNFNYLPFGSGRRICVGVLLAERMVVIFLASLLHYFDWKLPKGVKKFGIILKTRMQLVLVPTLRS